MPDCWQVLTDEASERERFRDRDAALRQSQTPAAPPNRLRAVTHIPGPAGGWFLKHFARTQWQNRLRFYATAPRSRSDAERELRMTQALRAAGFAAPTPVAWGRAGAASFYVCRALPGRSLATLLAAGAADGALLRRAAQHCGELLRRGFWLPDLSAEHVFAADDRRGFAVLDLHNGRLGRPGCPPRWLLRRVLRHCARSVRGLPVGWPTALRFAVRLLRAANATRDARALLRSLPPFHPAVRYAAVGKSRDYAGRNPCRTRRELRRLAQVWPGRPGETVLDLPCGAGRLWPLLHDRGHTVLAGDAALAMLREAGGRPDATHVPRFAADAAWLPLADRSVDGVVMFRFLHHLPAPERNQAVAEACRTARRFVVVSFFHPCSAHHLQRRVAGWLGRPTTRHATTLTALAQRFATQGFRLQAHAAELPFLRDLWIAVFVREPAPSTASGA